MTPGVVTPDVAKALAIALALAGCKAKSQTSEAVAKVEEFARYMCNCNDPLCAEKVNDEYTKWGTEMAQGKSAATETKPDPDAVRRMSDAVTKYGECFTKLAMLEPKPERAPVPEPPKPVEPTPVPAEASLPSSYPSDVTVDRLLHDAKAWAIANMPDLALVSVNAQYVHPGGTVDPKYSVITFEFDLPDRPLPDDPDRPTGAPVPAADENLTRQDGCPKVTWKQGDWEVEDRPCRKRQPIAGPRCTLGAVWERALADKAPDKAVAVLRIGAPHSAVSWSFSISDPVRKVSFNKRYFDNCELKVEKK